MDGRLAAIEARRARLVKRAARERADVAHTLQSWAQPLGFMDSCIGVVRLVISHPPLVAAVVFVSALLRPRRALKWAQRGWALWQSYRWLTRKIAV